MKDDFASLFAFDRWANAKMLDACRKLTPEQYAAEPVPGWSSVRFTVYHIAVVTDGWLRALADDPNQNFPTEEEAPTPDDAGRILDRVYGTLDLLLPTLTPELLATPRTFSILDRGYRTLESLLPTLTPELDRAYRILDRAYHALDSLRLPPWVVLRHVVNHTTYHRGQVASKLKRFGVQQPETDLVFWALEQVPQRA
jgi:uncharacterized damage-inducible protein DinB